MNNILGNWSEFSRCLPTDFWALTIFEESRENLERVKENIWENKGNMGEERAKKKKGMHETVTMDELHRPLLMKEYARERVSPKNTHKCKSKL